MLIGPAVNDLLVGQSDRVYANSREQRVCDQRIQREEAGEGLPKARPRTKARTKLKYHMIEFEVCAGMRSRLVVLG